VKLNEFKKAKLNELDLSSFLGDYGSAAVRSGLGSLGGKNVLSSTDQMAKDEFTKNFTSRAFSGLQSAINSGLVDPTAAGKTSGANIGTNFGKNPVTNPVKNPVKNPVTNPVTNPTTQTNPTAGKNVSPTPAQKLGAANTAGANAFGQMANQLTAKKSPEQIRQEKQAAATGVAQQQMANNGPFSKLPANQAAVQAGNIRQQKQGQAATAAQGQMTPKVAGPTPKTPEQIRQAKQLAATQAAQGQMAGNTTPPQNTTPSVQQQPAEPTTGKDAKLDAMKQKNPKLAAQMAAMGMDDEFNNKLNNVTKNKKTNAGNKAFGQMAQNLSKVNEDSRFDKLNYLFESILAEQDPAQGSTKQSISQYITNFFKQFMKGVNISDPTVTTQLASLAKELEQNYAKDKGKSSIPKLADLAWSVSHAEGGQEPQQATTTPGQTGANPSSASAAATTNTTPQAAQASTQQAKMTAAQITKLMQGLSTRQKQSILKSLQAQLSKAPPTNKKQVTPPAKNNTVKMPKIKGAKAGLPTADEEAKFQQRIQQAQQK
jgi:hypothetical protein